MNYRRGDDPGYTQLLHDRLEAAFGAGKLFMDVEGHIKPGDDFVDTLKQQIALSDIVLAVIGPRWQALLAARGGDPNDFVVVEIQSGLELGKRVIPVLVGGANPPAEGDLPDEIKALARRNAVILRPDRIKVDCDTFVALLRDGLATEAQRRVDRAEAEQRAAQEQKRREEQEAAERRRLAEEEARLRALANLSPEDIRRQEEVENWRFIQPRGRIDELRGHLARYPAGATARFATVALEAAEWARLGANPGFDALQVFLDAFPAGDHAFAARAKQEAILREQEAESRRREERERWQSVKSRNKIDEIRAHLTSYPSGVTTREAASALDDAVWWGLASPRKLAEVQAYLSAFPAGTHATEARELEKQLQDAESRKSPGQRALEQAEEKEEAFTFAQFRQAFPNKLGRLEAERLYREAGREPYTFWQIGRDAALGVLAWAFLVGLLANISFFFFGTEFNKVSQDFRPLAVATLLFLLCLTTFAIAAWWWFGIGAKHYAKEKHHSTRVELARFTVGLAGFLWVPAIMLYAGLIFCLYEFDKFLDPLLSEMFGMRAGNSGGSWVIYIGAILATIIIIGLNWHKSGWWLILFSPIIAYVSCAGLVGGSVGLLLFALGMPILVGFFLRHGHV